LRADRRVQSGIEEDEVRSESQRLLELDEVEQVYVDLGSRAPRVDWDDAAPHIDVPETLAHMQELPGRLYQVHSQPTATFRAPALKSHKKGGAYEMSQFRELVILSLAEMTRSQEPDSTALTQ
jgi:hypothetical protein